MMGRPRLLIFKVVKSPSNEYIIRTSSTRPRYRIAAHLCSRTKGCRNFIASTTPPYRGNWILCQPPIPLCVPPWAPEYVPQPSDYDASLLSNCYNSYVKNYIIWQTAVQKQKKKSLKSKYILEQLMHIFLTKTSKMQKTTSPLMQNTLVSVDSLNNEEQAYSHPVITVQECVMTSAEQEQNSPVDLSRESVPHDNNSVPSPEMEVTNSPNSISYVMEEPQYSYTEPGCVMSSIEQEQHSPVDLSSESYVYNDIYSVPSPSLEVTNSPASISYASREEPEYNYEPLECVMSPVQQELHFPVDLTRENYEGDDVYSIPSPAMEITVNDRINNEDAANQQLVEHREEILHIPTMAVLILKMEMAREM